MTNRDRRTCVESTKRTLVRVKKRESKKIKKRTKEKEKNRRMYQRRGSELRTLRRETVDQTNGSSQVVSRTDL